MLPEKWEKLCLYASAIDQPNCLQTGEMFFYYFPKGVLRKRPINVYEVPARFGIDEDQYIKLANDLYNEIKKLRKLSIQYGEKPWSNITIIIEKQRYRVIYGYEDLTLAEFDGKTMKTVWAYKNLNEPYESFNRNDRILIDRYETAVRPRQNSFELPLYNKEINKNLYKTRTLEDSLEFVTEAKMQEMEFIKNHIPKSQILSLK